MGILAQNAAFGRCSRNSELAYYNYWKPGFKVRIGFWDGVSLNISTNHVDDPINDDSVKQSSHLGRFPSRTLSSDSAWFCLFK